MRGPFGPPGSGSAARSEPGHHRVAPQPGERGTLPRGHCAENKRDPLGGLTISGGGRLITGWLLRCCGTRWGICLRS